MREAFGTTWSFQLIIIFILIFACFLSLVISYSRAYTLKNEMLTIIEKYEGVSKDSSNYEGSAKIINNYLNQNSYQTMGKCYVNGENWIGALDLDNVSFEAATPGTEYYYCFKETKSTNNTIYYNVRLFYKFNLPVLGDITTFKIEGQTNSFVGNSKRINY